MGEGCNTVTCEGRELISLGETEFYILGLEGSVEWSPEGAGLPKQGAIIGSYRGPGESSGSSQVQQAGFNQVQLHL